MEGEEGKKGEGADYDLRWWYNNLAALYLKSQAFVSCDCDADDDEDDFANVDNVSRGWCWQICALWSTMPNTLLTDDSKCYSATGFSVSALFVMCYFSFLSLLGLIMQ